MTAIISLCMLIPPGSGLETLISFFNFACWLIYGVSINALVVLRYTRPDLPRPYRVWLTTPITMTLMCLILVTLPFFDKPVNSAIALGMILLGIPFYFALVYFEPRHPAWFVGFRQKITKSMRKGMNLAPCEMY